MKSFKRNILSLSIILGLGTASAVAQSRLLVPRLAKGSLQQCPVATAPTHRLQALPRQALKSNDRLLGAYITDQIASTGNGLVNFPGKIQVGAFLPKDFIRKFDGCTLRAIRFGLPVAVTVSKVFIYAVDANGKVGDAIASTTVESQAIMGWNEQALPASPTVDASSEDFGGYLLGFEYEQLNTQRNGNYTADCFPLSFVKSGKTCRTYASTDGQWSDIDATSLGNLSVQAIARSDQYPQKDLILSAITIDNPLKQAGQSLKYSLTVENFGNDDIADYSVDLKLDDTVVKTFSGQLSSLQTTTLDGTIALDKELPSGSHSVSATVTAIDGSAPTERTADDLSTRPFAVYTQADALTRQQYLVEAFTTTAHPYASYGQQVMDALQKAHDDVLLVNIHSDTSGYGHDPFSNDASNELSLMLDIDNMPSAVLNRCYLGEKPINYYYGMEAMTAFDASYATTKANELFQVMRQQSVPALATIDVDAVAVDEDLTIHVSGQGGQYARQLLDKTARLSVMLVEDDIATSSSEERYDAVLRAMLTHIGGDEMAWTDDQHFSNTFTMKLPESWGPYNMRVVAFIHLDPNVLNPDYNNMGVSNATASELTVTTGIAGHPTQDTSARPVAIYSANGTARVSLQQGINLVRMSDGTTRKVIIR